MHSGCLQSSAQGNNRADRVESNIVFGVLHAHSPGCIDDCSFRRVVPSQAWARSNTCSRCDVDKGAAVTLLLHIRDDNVRRVVDRLDVYGKELVEVLIGDLSSGL